MGLTKQQRQMVIVLVVGAFLVVLNQTLLTPALPTIMDHLGVNATTVQWLTSGYSLVEAVIIPLNAYFLGRIPTRRLFLGGMVLFGVGSTLCASAPSFAFLMAGRICQACATGVVMPSVFALVLLVFPKERRGSAMGIIGLIVSFAPAIGPSLSGVLVDSIGWRALFVTVVACTVAILVLGFFMMKNFEGFARTTFDAPSVVLLALGMVGMLYGLSTFTSSDNPLASVALMVVGAAVLALFARRQMRLENPVLKVGVLANRQFRIAALIIIVLEAVLIGSGVIVPLYLQNAMGESATLSGLIMFPGAALGAFCGLFAGRVFDAKGVRGVAVTGAIVLLAGGVGYLMLSPSTPVALICIVYTVACLGTQFLITPLNSWGFNALPNAEIPHGNAIVSTFEQVGASLGTAFVVSLTAAPALLGIGAGSSAAEQAAAGCHAAFYGVLGLIAVIAVGIVLFVRDGKPAGRAPVDAVSAGAPGIDRPWLVSDVMNAQADALGAASTVREAIGHLRRAETSGLPIVDEAGRVIGFLSDGDILKRLSRNDLSRPSGNVYEVLLQTESVRERLSVMLDAPALEIATRRVVAVDADEDAEVAFRMLSEKRIKKMPVLREGKFVGTLSRRNIMSALAVLEQDAE